MMLYKPIKIGCKRLRKVGSSIYNFHVISVSWVFQKTLCNGINVSLAYTSRHVWKGDKHTPDQSNIQKIKNIYEHSSHQSLISSDNDQNAAVLIDSELLILPKSHYLNK